jgi:putative salt-induced outer membrane protein
MRFILLMIGLFSASASSVVWSADEGPWSGSAALGYLATSGNADNTSANGNFKLGYDSGSWHHGLEARAVGSSTDNATTAEAYGINAQSKYDLSEFNYVFGLLDWKKDRFSGYDQQTSEQVGYGRRILNTERHVWNAEIGAGARQSDLRDGTSQDETTVRVATDYVWNFSETGEFGQALIVESGSVNTFFESVSAIKATLVGNVALVASYTIRHNSSVPAGSEKQDTFTALSLEYSF